MLSALIVKIFFWAVVVAQLVEQFLPTPEVRGSNPVIGKFYITHILSTVLKRREIGNSPFKISVFTWSTSGGGGVKRPFGPLRI